MGKFFSTKKRLWAGPEGIQKKLTFYRFPALLKLERKIPKDLDLTLQQEELRLFQRSREDWLTSGDRNTKFYHISTVVCRRRNKLECLKNNTGEWITDPISLEGVVMDFYKNLYKEESRVFSFFSLPSPRNKLSYLTSRCRMMRSKALFSKWLPLKLDGMHVGFYQIEHVECSGSFSLQFCV